MTGCLYAHNLFGVFTLSDLSGSNKKCNSIGLRPIRIYSPGVVFGGDCDECLEQKGRVSSPGNFRLQWTVIADKWDLFCMLLKLAALFYTKEHMLQDRFSIQLVFPCGQTRDEYI